MTHPLTSKRASRDQLLDALAPIAAADEGSRLAMARLLASSFGDSPGKDADSRAIADFILDHAPGEAIIQIVPGLDFGETRLYPAPAYGWDGGYAISSESFNLVELATSDIASGPFASIARRDRSDLPGLAIHVGADFLCAQIFF